jgi:hypothetical protein
MSNLPDNDEQPEDPEPDYWLDPNNAAYLLGRNVWFIQGWLNAVQSIALVRERPWEWQPPRTLFGSSFDEPPDDQVEQINEALTTLVYAKAVDAATLVELHRAMDGAAEKCAAVAEFAHDDLRGDLCELYESAAYDLTRASDLQKKLLVDQNGSTEQWRQFGELLGQSVYFLADYFEPTDFQSAFACIIRLGRQLLSPESFDEFDQFFRSHVAETTRHTQKEINDKLISLIVKIDELALQSLQAMVPVFPYVVLDYSRELVVFLESEIAFDAFKKNNAAGGIDLLKVLMKTPGKFLSATHLIEECERSIDPLQLYPYISRFRRVIRRTKDRWPDEFKYGDNQRRAWSAFIISKRKSKRKVSDIESNSDSVGPAYKLDLPATRIRLIERVRIK